MVPEKTTAEETTAEEPTKKRVFYPWLSIHRALAVVFVVYFHFCQKLGVPIDTRTVTNGWPYVLPILATVSGFLHTGLTFRRAKRLFGLMMFGVGLNALAYVALPSVRITPDIKIYYNLIFHMWFVPALATFMLFHTYQKLVGVMVLVACLVSVLVYEDSVFIWIALTWSLCLGAEQAGRTYPEFAPYRHWAIWLIVNTGFVVGNKYEHSVFGREGVFGSTVSPVWEVLLLYWYYASGDKLDIMTLQRQVRKSAPLLFILYMVFGWANVDKLINGMKGTPVDVRIALACQRVAIISVSMALVTDTTVPWKRWMDPVAGMVYLAQVWPIVIAESLDIERGNGMCWLLTLVYVALLAAVGWGIDLYLREKRLKGKETREQISESKGVEIVELGEKGEQISESKGVEIVELGEKGEAIL